MAAKSRQTLHVIVHCCLLLACVAKSDDELVKDRTKNEIRDDIDYTTDGIYYDSTKYIDNFVTTESQLNGGPVKTTPSTPHSTKQSSKPKKKKDVLDPVDQYLLDGFLDIVDNKFDTFHKRLSTLERGVHTIQYYNVRGFRTINTHLQTVDTVLHGINRQLDHASQQNKAFDQGLGSIKKEMLDLQSLNTGMFQAIEQNLVHFHADMQSRLEELKRDMGKTNKIMGEVKNDTNEIRIDTDTVRNIQTDILLNTENSMIMTSDVAKGTLFLLNITEHVQQDVAENLIPSVSKSQQAIQVMQANISQIFTETHDIRNGLSNLLNNFSSEVPRRKNVFVDENMKVEPDNKEHKVVDSVTHATCSRLLEMVEDRLKNLTEVSAQSRPVPCNPSMINGPSFRNQSRKLMRALSTVNENIYQSVTLYKHTGSLIERVIADAELIASDQLKLREDIRAYLLNGTLGLFNESLPDVGEFVQFDRDNNDDRGSPKRGEDQRGMCQISKETINEISRLSYNGTQLLELLTELATTSTSSIQLSLGKLEAEVSRLRKVQAEPITNKPLFRKLDNFARDDPKVGASDSLKDIQNRTEWIYQLTEAIASNTGWIPYLFHSMRFVESQMNKSLKISNEMFTKTKDIASKQQIDASSLFKPQRYLTAELLKSQTNLHEMLSKFNEASKGVSIDKAEKGCDVQKLEVGYLSDLTNQSSVMASMMTFVHGTSVKLNRLIPALTYLLGEPEPYLTLLNGSSDKEGRVEIYNKGQWGTISGPLSHVEASYICRKLGYLGGVSAGSGSFGAGSGVFWSLNVTCLQTRWCTSVQHAPDQLSHAHQNDIGVICDHMIRLEPNEENLDLSRHTGKLEIYHENAWRPVCHDGWGRPETQVVCSQLGFREGAAIAVKDETLSRGQWLTNVGCKASEDRLDLCTNDGFVFEGCPTSEYVSMICS